MTCVEDNSLAARVGSNKKNPSSVNAQIHNGQECNQVYPGFVEEAIIVAALGLRVLPTMTIPLNGPIRPKVTQDIWPVPKAAKLQDSPNADVVFFALIIKEKVGCSIVGANSLDVVD